MDNGFCGGAKVMSPVFNNGFIFEKGDGRYLVVIETDAGKYLGVTVVQHNGSRFYSDNGNVKFPNEIPYASFSLADYKLDDLLNARNVINAALEKSREVAGERMQKMIPLDDIVQKSRVAQSFGDAGSDFEQAMVNFNYECYIAFGQHLAGGK